MLSKLSAIERASTDASIGPDTRSTDSHRNAYPDRTESDPHWIQTGFLRGRLISKDTVALQDFPASV